jgi:hypothetical protein
MIIYHLVIILSAHWLWMPPKWLRRAPSVWPPWLATGPVTVTSDQNSGFRGGTMQGYKSSGNLNTYTDIIDVVENFAGQKMPRSYRKSTSQRGWQQLRECGEMAIFWGVGNSQWSAEPVKYDRTVATYMGALNVIINHVNEVYVLFGCFWIADFQRENRLLLLRAQNFMSLTRYSL